MNKELQLAIEATPPAFSRFDYLCGEGELDLAGSYLYLVVYDYEHKDYEEKELVREKIHSKMYDILYGGMEPAFENSHCWGYAPLCQALTLIHNKQELWELFTEDEQKRIHQIMKMFLFMWNWGCNKYNNYITGAGMHGNFHKASSPNYLFTNNLLIIFLLHYFHGTCNGSNQFVEMNEILRNADYEAEMNILRDYGWNNALKSWTVPDRIGVNGSICYGTKHIFENGGKLTGEKRQFEVLCETSFGYGQGVKINISYWDTKNREKGLIPIPHGIIEQIYTDCFCNECKSVVEIEDYDYICSIQDKTTSPYEGRYGMMKEFNLEFDGVSTRSSLKHCKIDFYLVATTSAAIQLLGISNLQETAFWESIKVGMADYLYKEEHGYNGFSLGQREAIAEINIEQWKNHWLANNAI